LRLSERTATNIGLLYPKVRNNIGGGIYPLTSPPTKILGGCVPGIPGGVDASDRLLHGARSMRAVPRCQRTQEAEHRLALNPLAVGKLVQRNTNQTPESLIFDELCTIDKFP